MSSKILTNEILLTLKSFSYYRYSPESQKILYLTSQRDLKENKSFNELYIMNIDGTELKLISEPKINIEEPQFILQGKKIVYIQNNEIYIMNIDGTSKKKISENNKINNDIEGFLFDENLTKIIIIKLIKVPGLQVKKGNDAYPDCDKATNCYIADDLCYTHWDSLKDKIKRPFIYNIKYDKDKDDIIIDENSEINLLEKYTFECPSHYFGIQDEFCFNKTGDKIYFILKRFTCREYVVSTNCDLFEYSFGKDELLNICKGVYENINNLKINIYEDINFCLSFKNQQNKIQENVMKIYGEKTFYKKDKNGKIDFNLGYNNYPKLSPNNKLICWLGMERDGYESDINKLYIYNFDTKEKYCITENLETFISSFCWGLDNKTIYLTAVWDGVFKIYKTDIINKKTEKIYEDICDFNNLNILDKDTILVTKCSMIAPNDLYAINILNNNIKQLTFINKEIMDEIKPVKVEKRMVETFDKKSMLCWVLYPPDFDPTKKYPTILHCQWGPQMCVSQYSMNFALIASHGYIVISPNRRGLPGFGREWLEEISGDYYDYCMKDYLSAIDDISKEEYVNKDKLGAVGASFGAYSVFWLMGNHNKRFKAFVAHAGVFNQEMGYIETEEMWFENWDNGGAPWIKINGEKFQNYLHSPHLFVDKWDTPILIIHGENDYRILHSQGESAFHAARMRNIPARLLILKDDGHNLFKPQNALIWQREFFGWLDKYLK